MLKFLTKINFKNRRSRLSRRILLINLLALLIPLIGILQTNKYRQTLIEREENVLETDAKIFAAALASTAVIWGEFGEERLSPELALAALKRLESISGHRARLFVPGGILITDTAGTSFGSNSIQIEVLPDPSSLGDFNDLLNSLSSFLSYLTLENQKLEIYEEFPIQTASNYPEVVKALEGQNSRMVRQNSSGQLILTAAVPVQLYRRVLGALLLSTDGDNISLAIRRFHMDILLVFLISLSVTTLLSFVLSQTIARPIHQLAKAAEEVQILYSAPRKPVRTGHSLNPAVPILSSTLPHLTHRRDEIGYLSLSLQRMTQALRDQIDNMERFVADVSHEFRNPLTSMRSALENLARTPLAETDRKMLAIVQEDIGRLDRLIHDISESCRLDAEFSKTPPELFDLCHLLNTFVQINRQVSAHAFIVHIPPIALPVYGHRNRLAQVLQNLVENAQSFSPENGKIYLDAGSTQSEIWFSVGDDGPGIAEENLEKIFERFFSLRPNQEKFGNHSGLGLSICRQIIQAHGGRIVAQNRSPDGSQAGAIFTVTLPAI